MKPGRDAVLTHRQVRRGLANIVALPRSSRPVARNTPPWGRATQGERTVTVTGPAVEEAIHRGADDLPFVEIGDGNKLKVIQVDVGLGLWIVENIFQAGYEVQTHKHTGPVYAYTTRGAWRYKEYEYVNRAGSFLFEPAGSVHTLQCVEDDTHVWFQMYGSNLNLDADGNIESVFDGAGTLEAYLMLAEAEGYDRPNVLVS
jgi:2,4'-dihydroxyacetophenone dioxygenase